MGVKKNNLQGLAQTSYQKFFIGAGVSLVGGLAVLCGPIMGLFELPPFPKILTLVGVSLITVFACALVTGFVRYKRENVSGLMNFASESLHNVKKEKVTKKSVKKKSKKSKTTARSTASRLKKTKKSSKKKVKKKTTKKGAKKTSKKRRKR